LPPRESTPRQSRDVIIQVDAPPSHDLQILPSTVPASATPGHPNAGPSVPTSSQHTVVQIEGDHQPSFDVHAEPSYAEALFARVQGAAPVHAVQAATDLILSVLEAAALGQTVSSGAAQSLLQSGFQITLDTTFSAGLTGVMQTATVQTLRARFKSENETKEEALSRIQLLSALVSMGSSYVVDLSRSQIAASVLHQSLSAPGAGLVVVNSLVASGVISAGAFVLYKTNPAFQKQVDEQLYKVFQAVKNRLKSFYQSEDPPSFAQADAMELGRQAFQTGPDSVPNSRHSA